MSQNSWDTQQVAVQSPYVVLAGTFGLLTSSPRYMSGNMEIKDQEGLAWVPCQAQERTQNSGLEILLLIPDFAYSQNCV